MKRFFIIAILLGLVLGANTANRELDKSFATIETAPIFVVGDVSDELFAGRAWVVPVTVNEEHEYLFYFLKAKPEQVQCGSYFNTKTEKQALMEKEDYTKQERFLSGLAQAKLDRFIADGCNKTVKSSP